MCIRDSVYIMRTDINACPRTNFVVAHSLSCCRLVAICLWYIGVFLCCTLMIFRRLWLDVTRWADLNLHIRRLTRWKGIKFVSWPSWFFEVASPRAYTRVMHTGAWSHTSKVLGNLGWCGFLYRFHNVILCCCFVTTLFYSPRVLVTVEIKFTQYIYKTQKMQ